MMLYTHKITMVAFAGEDEELISVNQDQDVNEVANKIAKGYGAKVVDIQELNHNVIVEMFNATGVGNFNMFVAPEEHEQIEQKASELAKRYSAKVINISSI